MVSQYQIANHLIDFSRNQIIRDQHSEHEFIQTLPPKTILVLTVLAKSPGQVISHEQLMNAVWQDTVVSPNSLQRCIAQLRKALGDDSKQQRIIKTHAKQGYSLELPVIFIQGSTSPATQAVTEHYELAKKSASNANQTTSIDFDYHKSAQQAAAQKNGGNLSKRIIWSVSLIILITIGVISLSSTSRDFSFNTLTPITSSDNLERNASYSPDGKFILFHRFDGLCDNNIWAKEVATAKEHKLTKTYGFYSDHSFTENGDKLAFMAKVTCGKNKKINKETSKKQNACWNLMTLDFAKALKQPQQPELIVSCDKGVLAKPVWFNNGNIAALNQQADRWQIVKFMPGAPSYVPLYTDNDKNYYHLIYSDKQEQLIAIAINSLNEHVIDLISLQGKLLSSHLIERPEILSPYQLIEPIIDPQQDQLLFSTGKRLFSLSFNGEIEQISTLNHNNLANIKMNYNGESIVTVQGVVDTDIAKVNLENLNNVNNLSLIKKQRTDHNQAVSFNQVHQPYPSIARSIAEDYDAQFQPAGELIAFISTRSGTRQLWIKNNNQLSQLTNFPIDTSISNFKWEPSGASIMLAANSQLFKVSLDKTVERIPLKFAVLKLFQWQENNDLLMSVRQAGQPQLIAYNLTLNRLTTLIQEEINWAVETELNQLIYLDGRYRFWIKTANKSQRIEKLKGQFGSSRFILENGNIYSINKHKQLWSYTPKTNIFQILGEMDKYTNFISDIKQSELLLTQIIAAKTEVVVLSNNID